MKKVNTIQTPAAQRDCARRGRGVYAHAHVLQLLGPERGEDGVIRLSAALLHVLLPASQPRPAPGAALRSLSPLASHLSASKVTPTLTRGPPRFSASSPRTKETRALGAWAEGDLILPPHPHEPRPSPPPPQRPPRTSPPPASPALQNFLAPAATPPALPTRGQVAPGGSSPSQARNPDASGTHLPALRPFQDPIPPAPALSHPRAPHLHLPPRRTPSPTDLTWRSPHPACHTWRPRPALTRTLPPSGLTLGRFHSPAAPSPS
jgi:hypothetical protein